MEMAAAGGGDGGRDGGSYAEVTTDELGDGLFGPPRFWLQSDHSPTSAARVVLFTAPAPVAVNSPRIPQVPCGRTALSRSGAALRVALAP